MVMDREASSWALAHVQEAISEIRSEYVRPSVLFRPTLELFNDGTHVQYTVKYPGFNKFIISDTPDQAMRAFDHAWTTGV